MTTPPEVASAAIDTLLVLMHHREDCRQCLFDPAFCHTARQYERNFMQDVRRYEHLSKGGRAYESPVLATPPLARSANGPPARYGDSA